ERNIEQNPAQKGGTHLPEADLMDKFIRTSVKTKHTSIHPTYIHKIYGPFYRIGAKSGWKYFENLYVLFPKLCPYIYCTISKVHISSKLTVNFYIVFSECVGMFFLSQKLSLPKHSNKL